MVKVLILEDNWYYHFSTILKIVILILKTLSASLSKQQKQKKDYNKILDESKKLKMSDD